VFRAYTQGAALADTPPYGRKTFADFLAERVTTQAPK
jgi:hypothetical protein